MCRLCGAEGPVPGGPANGALISAKALELRILEQRIQLLPGNAQSPAIDDGSTAAQLFVGRTSRYRSVHALGDSDKNFHKALMEEIRKRGAMNRIISDNAKAEISARVKDILRTYVIDDWNSEAHQQRQNIQERFWGDTKAWVNAIMNGTGVPAEC